MISDCLRPIPSLTYCSTPCLPGKGGATDWKSAAETDKPLQELPASSPILDGTLGFPIREVQYRRPVAEEQPDLKRPVLEAVADADGRPMVLYSKFSIARACDEVTPYGCRGYSKADAERIAANIVLYALNF